MNGVGNFVFVFFILFFIIFFIIVLFFCFLSSLPIFFFSPFFVVHLEEERRNIPFSVDSFQNKERNGFFFLCVMLIIFLFFYFFFTQKIIISHLSDFDHITTKTIDSPKTKTIPKYSNPLPLARLVLNSFLRFPLFLFNLQSEKMFTK